MATRPAHPDGNLVVRIFGLIILLSLTVWFKHEWDFSRKFQHRFSLAWTDLVIPIASILLLVLLIWPPKQFKHHIVGALMGAGVTCLAIFGGWDHLVKVNWSRIGFDVLGLVIVALCVTFTLFGRVPVPHRLADWSSERNTSSRSSRRPVSATTRYS